MKYPDRTTAPRVSPFPQINIPQLRTVKLDNGIPLFVLDQGDNEVCRITIVRDGGTAEAVRPTVATLMAEMLCEGTKSVNGTALTDELEFNGAWFNCVAQRHHTTAVMYAINRTFGDVLPLLSAMSTEAIFPDDRFVTLREKAMSNASVRARQVKFKSLEIIRRMVYGETHPNSRVDTPEVIADIESNDLRQYYGSGIINETTAIYLAGRITPDMEDLVNTRFGLMKLGASAIRIERQPMMPVADRLNSAQVDGAMQGAVKMVIPTIGPSHPDYCDLSLAVTALGGYFGSRLMSNIREDKGYTYGIQSFLTGSADSGLMVIASEADNAYVQPLLMEVIDEVKRLATLPMTADELDRMCNFVLSQSVASLDSPFNIMSYYESLRYDDLPDNTFSRRIEAVNAINGAKIMEMASKYLDPNRIKIAVAGDVNAYPLDENRIFH